jgi:hypothetical protein
VFEDDTVCIGSFAWAPHGASYRNVADHIAFLLNASVSMEAHLVLEGETSGLSPESKRQIKQYELSARRYYRGREAECRALDRAEPKGGIGVDTPWKDYYEKAFFLNPSDRRAARKYAQSLLDTCFFEIGRGRFEAARELLQRASAIAPEVEGIYSADSLLHLAAGNRAELSQSLEVLSQLQPYSNLTRALRAERARMEGLDEEARHFDALLERSGGLSRRESAWLERALEAQQAGEARYAVPSLDMALTLLCKGPGGLTGNGRRAWRVAAAFDPDLLRKARDELLARLDEYGQADMDAVTGLGFYQDEEVRNRLREIYHRLQGPKRGIALEALARAGDSGAVIEVLEGGGGGSDLVVTATQIACDLRMDQALKALIDLLEDSNPAVRLGAYVALVQLTDVHFNYDPDGPPEERARSLKQWRRWYLLRTGEQDREGMK